MNLVMLAKGIRLYVSTIFRHSSVPPSNISRIEVKAFKSLFQLAL